MIEQTNFIRLCYELNKLNNQYERLEIKHYDYMSRYDQLISNFGYTKSSFIKELSAATNTNFLSSEHNHF